METILPPPATPPGDGGGPAAKTDGLAAAIAAGASPGTTSSAPARNVGGRPPTHGRYSQAAGSNGKTPVKIDGAKPVATVATSVADAQTAVETPPRVSIPSDLLARVVKEALSLTENAIANAIEAKARGAGLTIAEIGPQMAQARLGDDRKQLVADLAPFVAEEYGFDPQLSPTLAVALVLGPWAFASYTAFNTLSTLARERSARERPKETPPKPVE